MQHNGDQFCVHSLFLLLLVAKQVIHVQNATICLIF